MSQHDMFMDPKIRRTLIMLSKITADCAVVIHRGHDWKKAFFKQVDENRNVVVFGTGNSTMDAVPLDLIESVWWQDGHWRIACRSVLAPE
jgi:hypothetical protein